MAASTFSRVAVAVAVGGVLSAGSALASDTSGLKELKQEVESLKAEVHAQQTQIATLSKRVTESEAIEATRKLAFMYAYFMDTGLYDQVKTLFADKMEYCEISGYGLYEGRRGCELVWDKVVGQPPIRDETGHLPFGRFSQHELMKDVIHVDEDGLHAQGRFDYMGMGAALGVASDGGFQIGVYRMAFVRENGTWKINRFSLIFDVLDYHAGWSEHPTIRCPRPDVPKPDKPYTFYHPFPEVAVIPFEFPNPVTGQKIPEFTNPTHYWQGNWPGEFGGTCGSLPDAPKTVGGKATVVTNQ
jgi:SnoaL-like domain